MPVTVPAPAPAAASARILVTGGAGYIGSHTVVELLRAGFEVEVLDNLSNAHPEALRRAARLGGGEAPLTCADIADRQALQALLERRPCDAVIHFAGLKAVGESVLEPVRYYRNNVSGTLEMLQTLDRLGLRRIVFSSSATVYGDPQSLPLREDAAIAPANPYGQTKAMIERILQDLAASDPGWSVGVLRYFNPAGAHPTGLIGEDPAGTPNNLMPYIAQVAVGRRERLQVFGDDWPTPDGTGVRDYLHVMDLAEAHVAAVRTVLASPGLWTVNLGTGRGYSVLEVLAAYARACGRALPHEVVPRRSGDVAACYADATQAFARMGWRARRGLDEMCADSWRWQCLNPQGLRS